jgi:formylglycine-generating enzyme required for sulfatase activity
MSCCAGITGHGGTALPTPGVGGQPRPARLVAIPGGRIRIGTDRPVLPQDGEAARDATVKPFAIDPHAVTVSWFAEFAAATLYRTESETFGWSLVFAAGGPPAGPGSAPSWWRRIDGADWRHPHGPDSEAQPDHPVTHISWNDAQAFAVWAGGRLPTEAEWEHAAAGGLPGPTYPWGNAEPDDHAFLPCNIWQGTFPTRNTEADGHAGTAPVHSFPPNGYGLHNMAGNTWEWCAELFRIRSISPAARRRNAEARQRNMRLLKGGSHLCHRSYCHRYRIAARTGVDADSATSHVGFRLVFDLA